MNLFLKIIIGISITLVILIIGTVFALRPPVTVYSLQESSDTQLHALEDYILGELENALETYQHGQVTLTLEQEGFGQLLASTINDVSLPDNIELYGVYVDVKTNHIQIGGAFKALGLRVGLSGKFAATIQDNSLELNLLSTQIGRISLPMETVLRQLKQAGADVDKIQSISIPMDFNEEFAEAITIQDLSLDKGKILITVNIQPGVIPEISQAVKENFKEIVPEIQKALVNNPEAQAKLQEVAQYLEDEQTNPLTVKRLGVELVETLTDYETRELEKYIQEEPLDPEVKEFLQEILDTR